MLNAVLVNACPGKRGESNLGDCIQGLAANQFMQTDHWIDREALDAYDGADAKVIMNGWFMHHPDHFPPSPKIHPLFVSFHVSPAQADALLNDRVIRYLKEHGPIGCRDLTTVDLLQAKGIPAYFSACLTLTLGQTYKRPSEDRCEGVCFVDPFMSFKGRKVFLGFHWFLLHPMLCFKIYLRIKQQILSHQPLMFRLRMIARIGVFLRSFSKVFANKTLLEAEYLTHQLDGASFMSHQKGFDRADAMLRHYATRKLCVTPRIHCALPCLAMGVPTLFVNAEDNVISLGRFDGLLPLLNVAIAHPRGLELTGDPMHLPIHRNHLKYAEDLAEKCGNFVIGKGAPNGHM